MSSSPSDGTLVEKAKATVTDLVDLIGELNSYTEQLRSLLEQMEESDRDDH